MPATVSPVNLAQHGVRFGNCLLQSCVRSFLSAFSVNRSLGRESSVWGSYFGETSLMSGGDPIKAIDL